MWRQWKEQSARRTEKNRSNCINVLRSAFVMDFRRDFFRVDEFSFEILCIFFTNFLLDFRTTIANYLKNCQ